MGILETIVSVCVSNNSCHTAIVLPQIHRTKELCEIIMGLAPEDTEYSLSNRRFTFKNGSRLYFMSANNPDTLRGMRFRYVVVLDPESINEYSYLMTAILYPATIHFGGEILTTTYDNITTPTVSSDINSEAVNENCLIFNMRGPNA